MSLPGPQTLRLRDQLQAMPDGGRVVITVPPSPYRCPPGPYERASLMAWYLSREKPRSKVLILDGSDGMPKADLFQEGWHTLYPGRIERISAAEGGRVTGVDVEAMTVTAEAGRFPGDVHQRHPAAAGRRHRHWYRSIVADSFATRI